MSTKTTEQGTTIDDPTAAVRAAREAGAQKLRALRERKAARIAATAEQTAREEAEEAEAEAEFAEQVAMEDRISRATAARETFTTAEDNYRPAAEKADQLIAQLDTTIADVIRLCGDAVLAERARDKAGKRLTAAHQTLTQHDPTAPRPRITGLRLHGQGLDNPRGLIGLATALTDTRFTDERAAAQRLVQPQKPIRGAVTVNGIRYN